MNSKTGITIKPQEIFSMAIELCPVGIVVAGEDDKIILLNVEMERLFGYAREEVIGQPIDILLTAKQRADSGDRMKAGHHLTARRKDGCELAVEVGIKSMQAGEGSLTICVVVDVSERIRMEGLRDEFVATVSHELRTPLTSISGALSLLVANSGATLPAPTMRLLSIAQANSQRLVRLVNSILDMEKIESGKVVFVLKRVEVLALVERAIEASRGFAKIGRAHV